MAPRTQVIVVLGSTGDMATRKVIHSHPSPSLQPYTCHIFTSDLPGFVPDVDGAGFGSGEYLLHRCNSWYVFCISELFCWSQSLYEEVRLYSCCGLNCKELEITFLSLSNNRQRGTGEGRRKLQELHRPFPRPWAASKLFEALHTVNRGLLG